MSTGEKVFEEMERQLREFNEGKIPEPMFDDEVFKAFRRWQQQRIAAMPFHITEDKKKLL